MPGARAAAPAAPGRAGSSGRTARSRPRESGSIRLRRPPAPPRRGPPPPPPRCRRSSRRACARGSTGCASRPTWATRSTGTAHSSGTLRLADHDRARPRAARRTTSASCARRLAVGVRAERRQLAGHVDVVLDRDRNAEQRPLARPPAPARVGLVGLQPRALGEHDAKRVQLPGRSRAIRSRYSSTSSREETSPAAISSACRAMPAYASSTASMPGNLVDRRRRAHEPPPGGRAVRRGPRAVHVSATRGRHSSTMAQGNRSCTGKGGAPCPIPSPSKPTTSSSAAGSRAFFRLILVIPLLIVVYVYGILAFVRGRHRMVCDRDHRPLPEGAVRLRRGLHALPHARHRLRGAAVRPLPALLRVATTRLSGADAVRRAARALQPAEDVLSHHPRDPDRDPALRHAACCSRSARSRPGS